MAKKWINQDSARNMTNKYNEAVDEINDLKKKSTQINEATTEEFEKTQKLISEKLTNITAESIGLGRVNNTSDEEKPVSKRQKLAIEDAIEPMLTSKVTSPEDFSSSLDDMEPWEILEYVNTIKTQIDEISESLNNITSVTLEEVKEISQKSIGTHNNNKDSHEAAFENHNNNKDSHEAAFENHNNNSNAHFELLHLLQRNKTYTVGDIAYHKDLPSWARLECVQAGTTGDSISLSSVTKAGGLVPDGTAVWIIDDVRDGHRVGDIALRYTLRYGFIKLNGATVLREDYPRLVQWVEENNLWTDDDSALGLFGVGDGLTTMRLPDFRNRFIEGVDSNGGVVVGAGVPNINGDWQALHDGAANAWNGAVYMGGGANNFAGTIAGAFGTIGYILDASKSSNIYGASSTVQPAAVRLIAQIKY